MLLCRISCELAGCVHQPILGSGQTNLSHLYFSRLSLAMPAKLNFFKTPTSVRLVQVGPCPLPLEYQAATSHTGRQPCRVKSLYMKRFWLRPRLELSFCTLVCCRKSWRSGLLYCLLRSASFAVSSLASHHFHCQAVGFLNSCIHM